MMKSYSSEFPGLRSFVRDVAGLYQLHYSQDIVNRVRTSIEDAHRVEARIREHCAIELRDLDMLEIGPGQFVSQLTYFAIHNRAVGIDRDVIARGLKPSDYVDMLRINGLGRTIKNIGRKMMAVDRKYASQLIGQLNLKRLPPVTVHTMDVCSMSFANESFDFVYTRSVLHSLRDPVAAVNEIVRVLRPGGVAYVSIHPYTSATGCLDPRIYTKRRHEVEGWPHLRPQLRDTLTAPNLYLSKLRIKDWYSLFGEKMPDARYIVARSDNAGMLEEQARTLQGNGELLDYSLEELLAGEFVAIWKKPKYPSTRAGEFAHADSFSPSFPANK